MHFIISFEEQIRCFQKPNLNLLNILTKNLFEQCLIKMVLMTKTLRKNYVILSKGNINSYKIRSSKSEQFESKSFLKSSCSETIIVYK